MRPDRQITSGKDGWQMERWRRYRGKMLRCIRCCIDVLKCSMCVAARDLLDRAREGGGGGGLPRS